MWSQIAISFFSLSQNRDGVYLRVRYVYWIRILILREAEINGGHLPRFRSTGTRLTVHVLVLVCACVCVMTFPQRARARFISHKHEPMDPITL